MRKVGITPDNISKMLMKYTKRGAPTSGSYGKKIFQPFDRSHYRENLATFTGKDPGNLFQAHHAFPQTDAFSAIFKNAGINVDDPKYMQWWSKETHQLFSNEYNAEWRDFLIDTRNHAPDKILGFGRDIMNRYGLTPFF